MLNVKSCFTIIKGLNILAFSSVFVKSHEWISDRYFLYIVKVVLAFTKKSNRVYNIKLKNHTYTTENTIYLLYPDKLRHRHCYGKMLSSNEIHSFQWCCNLVFPRCSQERVSIPFQVDDCCYCLLIFLDSSHSRVGPSNLLVWRYCTHDNIQHLKPEKYITEHDEDTFHTQ